MELTPVVPAGRQIIQGYGGGGFRITGVRHVGSVLVFPSATLAWPVVALEELNVESLAAVAGANPTVEILLIGTGRSMLPIPPVLRRDLRAAGIMPDAMDTGAACRTYNVLAAEERRVAAALIAVS